MKVIGKYVGKKLVDDDYVVGFKVTTDFIKSINSLTEQDYEIDISKVKDKRTLSQNALLRKLCADISKKQDGNVKDAQKVYLQILQMAGVKIEMATMTKEAYEGLVKMSEITHIYPTILSEEVINHTLYCTCQLCYGSSLMNTEQMSKLIDTAIDYYQKIGGNVEYFTSIERGL